MASGSKTKKSSRRSSKPTEICSLLLVRQTWLAGMRITLAQHLFDRIAEQKARVESELSGSMSIQEMAKISSGVEMRLTQLCNLYIRRGFLNQLSSSRVTAGTRTGSLKKTSTRRRGAATPKD